MVVNLANLASETCGGLNLQEELKKQLLPSPPSSPSKHAERSVQVVFALVVLATKSTGSIASSIDRRRADRTLQLFLSVRTLVFALSWHRKRKLQLSIPEAQKKLKEGQFSITSLLLCSFHA